MTIQTACYVCMECVQTIDIVVDVDVGAEKNPFKCAVLSIHALRFRFFALLLHNNQSSLLRLLLMCLNILQNKNGSQRLLDLQIELKNLIRNSYCLSYFISFNSIPNELDFIPGTYETSMMSIQLNLIILFENVGSDCSLFYLFFFFNSNRFEIAVLRTCFPFISCQGIIKLDLEEDFLLQIVWRQSGNLVIFNCNANHTTLFIWFISMAIKKFYGWLFWQGEWTRFRI